MLQALFFGLLAGSAVFFGALVGIYTKINKKTIAAIMAFGSGVLISALSLDLMEEANASGGFIAVSIGFVLGGLFYVIGDYFIDNAGGHARKSVHSKLHNKRNPGVVAISGMALFLGAMLDGIPESSAIGINLLSGTNMGILLLVAVFLSNFPEGASGAIGMKQAGKSNKYILVLWFSTVLISGLSAFVGYTFLGHSSEHFQAATMAFAAGAILAMITDTMIPEAFERGGRFVALMAVFGFLVAFIISRVAKG
jgi:ZIP family zinc transporter